MRAILILFCLLFTGILLSGCAVRQAGTRTVNYSADGLTVASETVNAPTSDIVELEKEKSVQVCWKEYGKANKAIIDAVKEQPLVAALLKQTDALNNAMSLLKTGKNYNPCQSSPNSVEADIADSAMYTSIWHDGFGFAKFLGGMWIGSEMVDSIIGGIRKAGGLALSSGDNSPISLTDSANTFTLGATSGGSSLGNLFSKTDNHIENALPEPAVDETLISAQ